MNITRENIDDLNAVLKVHLVKEDWDEKVNSVLKDYKKKASIKGFRPGMVPFGLIKKMYGTAARVEEINKLVSEGLNNYISSEKIEILGDPLPKQDENEEVNFEKDEEFNFSFELGLAPEFELNLNNKTRFTYYEIKIDEKLRQGFIDNYTRRYGNYDPATVVGEEDLVKCDVSEVPGQDSGHDHTHGAENSTISVAVIKDEKVKKSFVGSKPGDTVEFDIRKAFPNDHEIAGILQVGKDHAAHISGTYLARINEITRFTPAPVDQDLFDKIYGEGVIKSKDEFIARLDEEIGMQLKTESEYKALIDIRKLATEKTSFKLPEDFLRRWLLRTNKELTEEEVEKDFENFLLDLRWQLIRNRIVKDNDLKIEPDELMAEAREYTKQQFNQYGLYYATDEQIDNFAKEMLKREEEYRKIADKLIEEKVSATIRNTVKVETKKVTTDEFNKLLSK